MAKVITNQEFIKRLKDIADNYKTLYVYKCFGAPLVGQSVTRYCNNCSYNKKASRTNKIKAAADQSPPVYGFDCSGLIKGVLWGWNGNATATYGGVKYASNDVPDKSANQLINLCSDVSTDFSEIEVGEAVWKEGHIGIYIGDGLAIECTPKWKDGVQYTACNCTKSGYNSRYWTKHGKLPYIEYLANGDDEMKLPTLRKGNKSETVGALQAMLIGYGYSCGSYGVDNSFGGATQKAVFAYQEDNDLEVDGVVGSKTWNSLLGLD